MSLKKNKPQSAATGHYVSPEYAEKHKDTTVQTTITVPIEKYKEAEELMNQLGDKNKTSLYGLNSEETAMFDLLLWLIGDGEKPEL